MKLAYKCYELNKDKENYKIELDEKDNAGILEKLCRINLIKSQVDDKFVGY